MISLFYHIVIFFEIDLVYSEIIIIFAIENIIY